MSCFSGTKIVNSGLVFHADMLNVSKSYKGPTLQNLVNTLNLAGVGTYTGYVSVGTTETVNIPEVGTVLSYKNTIQNNYTTYTPNSTICCPSLHSWGGITVSPSTLYTYFLLYKCESGYTSSNYMYRYEWTANGGTLTTEGGVHSNDNRVHLGRGWYYSWGTFTTAATTNYLGYCGTHYYQYSTTSDSLSVAKVAIVAGNYSGLHPKYWPSLSSARTSSQAILDLTKNTTMTISNLSYSSDGTFKFDGTDDRIDCGTNFSSTISGTKEFSIECWVYPGATQATYADIWGNHNEPYCGVVMQQDAVTLNRYSWSFGDGSSWFDSNKFQLTTQQYSHVVAVKTTNNMITYVNGVEVANASRPGASVTPNTAYNFQLGIGYHLDSGRYWNGSISNFKIYSKALSSTEVQQNYQASKAQHDYLNNKLVLHYDANTLTSYPGSGTTWYDLSRTGNHANLYNGPTFSVGSIVFDGSNDYAVFSRTIDVTQPYTLILWAKPNTALLTGATPPTGFNRKTPIVGPGPVWNPGIWATNDNLRVHCNTEYRDLYITWTDTTWRMIGQTFDGSTCRIIYKGNVYVGDRISGYGPPTPTVMYLGAEATGGNSQNWNGAISSVMFYSRVLSSTEILQQFNALRGRYGI